MFLQFLPPEKISTHYDALIFIPNHMLTKISCVFANLIENDLNSCFSVEILDVAQFVSKM